MCREACASCSTSGRESKGPAGLVLVPVRRVSGSRRPAKRYSPEVNSFSSACNCSSWRSASTARPCCRSVTALSGNPPGPGRSPGCGDDLQSELFLRSSGRCGGGRGVVAAFGPLHQKSTASPQARPTKPTHRRDDRLPHRHRAIIHRMHPGHNAPTRQSRLGPARDCPPVPGRRDGRRPETGRRMLCTVPATGGLQVLHLLPGRRDAGPLPRARPAARQFGGRARPPERSGVGDSDVHPAAQGNPLPGSVPTRVLPACSRPPKSCQRLVSAFPPGRRRPSSIMKNAAPNTAPHP